MIGCATKFIMWCTSFIASLFQLNFKKLHMNGITTNFNTFKNIIFIIKDIIFRITNN